jgi:hypothetical protein
MSDHGHASLIPSVRPAQIEVATTTPARAHIAATASKRSPELRLRISRILSASICLERIVARRGAAIFIADVLVEDYFPSLNPYLR